MSRNWVRVLGCIAGLLAGASALGAEQWVRKNMAPDSYVRNTRVFSNTPVAGQTTIYAATLSNGVQKIIDTGTSQQVNAVNNGLPVLRIRSVAGTDVSNLYVGIDSHGVYKTSDGGANWVAASGTGATALGCREVRNISVRTISEVWAVTGCRYDSGVYRTEDGGATWSRLGASVIPDDAAVTSTTFSGTGAGTIVIAATARNGLYRSADNGATWAQINNGLPTAGSPNTLSAFNAVFVGTSTTEMLAYVEGKGIYRTVDGGANWSAYGTGLPNPLHSLAGITRQSGTRFFVGSDKGPVYESVNSGATWAPWGTSGSNDETQYVRGINADSSGRFYLATHNGLQRTTTTAASFLFIYTGEGNVSDMVLDPDGKTFYIAATELYKVPDLYLPFSPTNDGVDISAGIPGSLVSAVIAQDKTQPATLFAGVTNAGLYRTTNGGTNWSKLNLPNVEAGANPAMSISPSNGQVVYAWPQNKYGSATGGGLYKSVDGGTTWTDSSTGLDTPEARDVNSMAQHQDAPSALVIATGDGLYRSTDAGVSWTATLRIVDNKATKLPFGSVRFHPADPTILYAAATHANSDGTLRASSGVWKSIDGGSVWSQVLSGKRASAVRVEVSGRVVAMFSRDLSQPALLSSTDGGTTWTAFNNGIGENDGMVLSQSTRELGSRVVFASMSTGLYVLAKPQLSVAVVGGGSVASTPAGFSCSSGTCNQAYFNNEEVTLVATADSGFVFTGWGGACAGTANCVVTMDGSKDVTATFVAIAANPTASASPASRVFPSQAVGTTSSAQTVSITNIGAGTLTVTSVSTTDPQQFAASHDCSSLATGVSCTVTLTFTPTALGARTGSLSVVTNGGTASVSLSGTGIASAVFANNVNAVVTGYYETILGRSPDAGGLQFWADEATRVVALGADVREVFFAMSIAFFGSPEYVNRATSDTQFLTDMYRTFFVREPDGEGLTYWQGELTSIGSRSALLNSFLFSTEFSNQMTALFGTNNVRPEVNMTIDLFRGTLGRLPDSDGFNFWLGQIRAAQCGGVNAGNLVNAKLGELTNLFFGEAEYVARGRNDRDFMGDIYNTYLRRGPGGDAAGFNFWVGQIASQGRDGVRAQFLPSPEFQNRVGAVVAAGCFTG